MCDGRGKARSHFDVGLIQLKDVICCGNETSIMECRCQQPGLIDSTCSTHSRDVSVLCIGTVLLMAI